MKPPITELSETERRELVKFTEECKPLPARYRFLPFADYPDLRLYFRKRVAELPLAQGSSLGLTSAPHTYGKPDRYTVAVKVSGIFSNDAIALLPVSVD